jgi:hypothetical protein
MVGGTFDAARLETEGVTFCFRPGFGAGMGPATGGISCGVDANDPDVEAQHDGLTNPLVPVLGQRLHESNGPR